MSNVRRALGLGGIVFILSIVAAVAVVGSAALVLDHRFPSLYLDGLTLDEARAHLGEPTNLWYGPFDPNWSRDIRLMGVFLAEKTIFAHSLWDPADRAQMTRVAWRFPAGIHLNHGYEKGYAVGLFCYTDPFECRLEP